MNTDPGWFGETSQLEREINATWIQQSRKIPEVGRLRAQCDPIILGGSEPWLCLPCHILGFILSSGWILSGLQQLSVQLSHPHSTLSEKGRNVFLKSPRRNTLLWLSQLWPGPHCELWPKGWRNGQIYTGQVSHQAGSIVTFPRAMWVPTQKSPSPVRRNWSLRTSRKCPPWPGCSVKLLFFANVSKELFLQALTTRIFIQKMLIINLQILLHGTF